MARFLAIVSFGALLAISTSGGPGKDAILLHADHDNLGAALENCGSMNMAIVPLITLSLSGARRSMRRVQPGLLSSLGA